MIQPVFIMKTLISSSFYQNLTYINVMIIKVVTTIAICVGDNLNMVLSKIKAFAFTAGPVKLTPIIATIVKKNDHPIPTKKGISNPPLPFGNAVYNKVSLPNTCGA